MAQVPTMTSGSKAAIVAEDAWAHDYVWSTPRVVQLHDAWEAAVNSNEPSDEAREEASVVAFSDELTEAEVEEQREAHAWALHDEFAAKLEARLHDAIHAAQRVAVAQLLRRRPAAPVGRGRGGRRARARSGSRRTATSCAGRG